MVKVAVAGATSELAREVIDTLAATRKHDILALVRKDPALFPSLPGVQWIQTTYEDKSELVQLLKSVHTVLSFMDTTKDSSCESQKRILDAAVEAGVKRFAPSEWSMGLEMENCLNAFPWYVGKLQMRQYLQKLNEETKVIEYTLFQPGLFLEYVGHPHKTTKHVTPIDMPTSLSHARIIGMEGHLDDKLVLTSVEDIAGVVARAVEYQGEWPVVGGIRGDSGSLSQFQRLGEKLRGTPFRVDLLKKEDLKAGILKLDDPPIIAHHSTPKDQVEAFSKIALIGLVLSTHQGGWNVTDEWNKLLPDYKFTSIEDYYVRKLKDAK